jgi:acyl-coenzyme A synthetase/AMP-(fatty) acid ligase
MSERFNFTADVVERLAEERPGDEALVARSDAGGRRSFSFSDVARETVRAAAGLARADVEKGDVVMTLMPARPEWVFAMLASWRLGAAALPCSEQLRKQDIASRIEAAKPKVVVAAGRDLEQLEPALEAIEDPPLCIDVDSMPGQLFSDEPAPATDTSAGDPALVIFTSGTAGEPRGAVHSQRYLRGQRIQAMHWLGAGEGDLVWCTAASGWSKSARNSFVAPWTRGAACLLDDARFDPERRISILEEERVTILCQTPTEYRMIAKRATLESVRLHALRRLVSAGEPLEPQVLGSFDQALGLAIHDGFGKTETGQLSGLQAGEEIRP